MTTNTRPDPRDLDLPPRAVAALCALRLGSLATVAIRVAIRDGRGDDTEALLVDLRGLRLVDAVAHDPQSDVWHLADDGVIWLAHRGTRVYGVRGLAPQDAL